MDTLTAIAGRRSYRGPYKKDPVPRADLRAILDAALAAPSGCNKQTASFIAVDDPEILRRIGELLAKPGFASAPAGIAVLAERKTAYRDRTYFVQDYAAATENALLAIEALGYASCWVEGYITDLDRIGRKMADLLRVPENLELVIWLPVGRPAETAPRAARLPFAERAWFNGYRAGE